MRTKISSDLITLPSGRLATCNGATREDFVDFLNDFLPGDRLEIMASLDTAQYIQELENPITGTQPPASKVVGFEAPTQIVTASECAGKYSIFAQDLI